MPGAQQELVENQHAGQFHVDEQTGVKTPIREWLKDEVERLGQGVNEGVERAKAAVEAEKQRLEARLAELEAEVAKAKDAEQDKVLTAKEKATRKPPATAVRETGEVKS